MDDVELTLLCLRLYVLMATRHPFMVGSLFNEPKFIFSVTALLKSVDFNVKFDALVLLDSLVQLLDKNKQLIVNF